MAPQYNYPIPKESFEVMSTGGDARTRYPRVFVYQKKVLGTRTRNILSFNLFFFFVT